MPNDQRAGSTAAETCHLFHDWPRWSAVRVGKALLDGKPTGDLVYQERTCRRCGKTKMRQVAR